MAYKTILVHLDNGARRLERLALAATLASAHDAHLTALFALSEPPYPPYALAGGGGLLRAEMQRRQVEAAAAAQAEFRAFVEREGLQNAEWRESRRDALAALQESARYADLVVLGQPRRADDDGSGLATDFHDEVLVSLGRPVMFLPWAGRFPRTGEHVLVAWDAGREAMRAVSDALPVLERARRVDILVVDAADNGRHGEEPGADVALFLARHGVNAIVSRTESSGIGIGSTLLSRAADFGVDLIVMGAYGHSRLRESLVGGATRDLLQAMTVPVLMSR
jgi:nucleotide-binding universal stress UspA family protein